MGNETEFVEIFLIKFIGAIVIHAISEHNSLFFFILLTPTNIFPRTGNSFFLVLCSQILIPLAKGKWLQVEGNK